MPNTTAHRHLQATSGGTLGEMGVRGEGCTGSLPGSGFKVEGFGSRFEVEYLGLVLRGCDLPAGRFKIKKYVLAQQRKFKLKCLTLKAQALMPQTLSIDRVLNLKSLGLGPRTLYLKPWSSTWILDLGGSALGGEWVGGHMRPCTCDVLDSVLRI